MEKMKGNENEYPEELAKMDAELSFWRARYKSYSYAIIRLAKKGKFEEIPEVAAKLNESERMEKSVLHSRKEPFRLYLEGRYKK